MPAQLYQPGDIVENFTLTDRATGKPVSLHDFEGSIIFLEWFAHWCPFCQAAAARTVPDIDQYYHDLGGNPDGIPVVHLHLNLQGGQEAQTQAFIDFFHIGRVLNDFEAAVARRFQSGGQPIFAIINGVAASPSHKQWELLYSHLGYGNLNQPITTFRSVIDSVKAGAVTAPEPPAILRHPLSRTVPAGTNVTLAVEAGGAGPLAYLWKKDEEPLPDATAAVLDLGAVEASDAGDYSVTITGAGGTVTSRRARLIVADPIPGRIVNLSVRSRVDGGGSPLIVGFVVEGGARPLLVRSVGPGLAAYGVADTLEDPTLTVLAGGNTVAANDNWSDTGAAALTQAFRQAGAFDLEAPGRDAALLTELAGAHTVHVNSRDATSGTVLTEIYDLGADDEGARLVNISARNVIGGGDDTLIAGFSITGNTPRTLLVRAVGPSLAQFELTGFLPDPVLRIFEQTTDGDILFATNDDWEQEANADAAQSAVPGAFLLQSASTDAALLLTLPAGSYTAVVGGPAGSTGEALIEVYEVP